MGRVFYYGNARGVGGEEDFELEIYLQNLESGYILEERKCPIPFGRLHICLTIAAQVKGLGGYFFTLYLSFLGKRAML